MLWPPLLTPTPLEALRLQACFVDLESAFEAYDVLAGKELGRLTHDQCCDLVRFYDAVGRMSECPVDNMGTVDDFDERDFDESDWSNINEVVSELQGICDWLWEIGGVLTDAGLPDSRNWTLDEFGRFRLALCSHIPQYSIASLLKCEDSAIIPELICPQSDVHSLQLQIVDRDFNLTLEPLELLSVPELDPFARVRGLLLENSIPRMDRGTSPIAILAKWDQFIESKEESFEHWMQKNPCITAPWMFDKPNDWVPLGKLCKLISLERGTVRYAVMKLNESTQRKKDGRQIMVRYSAFRALAIREWQHCLPMTFEDNMH